MSVTETGDRIFLRGLKVDCIIGFIEWERRLPQTLVIDLELPCDCARGAQRRGGRHHRLQGRSQARAGVGR